MRNELIDIGALFDEDELLADESGALALVFDRLRRAGANRIILVDEPGRILSAYPCADRNDQEVVAAAELLAQRLTRTDYTQFELPECGVTPLSVIGLPASCPHEVRTYMGVIFERTDAIARSALDDKNELKALARLARLADWQAEQLKEERTRIRHLLAAQETLKRVHADTVAHVLQEREDRLQEKRGHILELESEVERRSAALRKATEAAESASRSKSEFLANMSHEIRTPMTAILGYADNLLDPELSPEDRAAATQTIRRNGGHLLELINDILDLSKIEAGRLEPEFIDCSPVKIAAEIYELMKTRAEEKGLSWSVEFEGPIPEVIATDPARLRQILTNLVGNAIKFTDAGEVKLKVSWPRDPLHERKRRGRKPLRFEVSDTGIGMTGEQLNSVFQPFTQADSSTTRKYGGTGLGLSISKRLALILGGDLTATSRSEKGSALVLTIDAGVADRTRVIESVSAQDFSDCLNAKNARPETILSDDLLAGSRILLAEDGPDNQRLIAFVLRKAGAEVAVSENGDEALEQIRGAESAGKPFDLILMDMQMPVLDGYDAARRLREDGYSAPIIALTAHAMNGDREKCIAAGCDDYATKPIDRQNLMTMLQKYLQAARAGSSNGA